MKTPLEVIEEGQEALTFEGKLYMTGDWLWHKTQKQALLQALHDELEGKKIKQKETETWDTELKTIVYGRRLEIQDQQDNLQALMDKIRVWVQTL